MKALLLTAAKHLQLADLPEPEVDDETVLVRVGACGICGSDVHGYDGSTGRRRPPIVMGHEAAGIVERVGADVTKFSPGDRVTFDSTVYCGACDYCTRGEINLCDNRQVLGVSCEDYRRHGAFAELVAVPQHIVYRLPEDLPLGHAALIEAVSVAVHAAARAGVAEGDSAVVVGTGMIGLLVVQALRARGASRIVAVDIDDDRLQLAKRLGATDTVNSGDDGAASRVLKVVPAGASHTFEVVGTTTTLNMAIAAARKGGTVTLVGNVAPQVELPLQSVVTRELSLLGSCASQGEYPECIRLMTSGEIDVAPLLSATAPLEDGPRWFERLYGREPGLMKVVLTPNE